MLSSPLAKTPHALVYNSERQLLFSESVCPSLSQYDADFIIEALWFGRAISQIALLFQDFLFILVFKNNIVFKLSGYKSKLRSHHIYKSA